jgi:hypothetical protein
METKECSVCHEVKSFDLFYENKATGKPRDKCKKCHAAYRKLYHESRAAEVAAEKEAKLQLLTEGFKVCPECNLKLSVDSYYTVSKGRNLGGLSRVCKPCDKERKRLDYLKNPDKVIDRTKEWAKNNPEKLKARRLKSQDKDNARRRAKAKETSEKKKQKRHADPKFNIDILMSNQIRKVLKEAGSSKQGLGWERCVGYTVAELATHLESLFADGMSWDNQGTLWEIDHVIPKDWYVYADKDDTEFKKCWSLKNLQPLTKSDNTTKQHRYAGSPANPIYSKDLYDDNRVTHEDLRRLRPDKNCNRIFQG